MRSVFCNMLSLYRKKETQKTMNKLVIFDLDGTLLNTLDDLAEAVNHAMSDKGFPEHTSLDYMTMVGNGVRKLVQRAMPSGAKEDEALVDNCLADFKQYYSSHIDVLTKPYEGIPEVLRDLQDKGISIAVASNKFQAGTEKLLGKMFPDIRFAAILGDREGKPLKPDPKIEYEAMEAAKADEAVYVGDSVTDMQTAFNAGLPAIAVSWGYRRREELEACHPAAIVDSIRGLREAIGKLMEIGL